MSAVLSPNLLLPWTPQVEDDRRLRNLMVAGLLAFLGFVAAVQIITLPVPPKLIPPAVKVLIVEQPVVLPEPPLVEEPPAPPVEEVKPEPVPDVKPEPKPEIKPEPKPKVEPPKVQPKNPTTAKSEAPVNETAQQEARLSNARNQAAKAGVMQAQNDLAAMRESLNISDVAKPTQATVNAAGATTAATVDRAIISSGATAKSGGINVASLSRDTGGAGGALGGRKAAAVQSKLAESQQIAAASQAAAAANGGKGARTDEEVKKVLDAAKARITAAYYRILDEDPTLQGRMVFKLVIEASGAVSDVKLVSSDIKNGDLEKKISALLRGLNFGARDVQIYAQNVPIDLFPS